MAEILDDINNDPGPKPAPLTDDHRAKLDAIIGKMISNKESDAAIQAVVNDYKSKYTTPTQTTPQPAFKVDISQPTFTSAPTKTGARTFEFGTEQPKVTKLQGLQGEAVSANAALHNELESNNDVKLDIVKHRTPLQKMADEATAVKSDMPKTSADIAVQRLGLQPKPEAPEADVISKEQDLKTVNDYIKYDRNNASHFLKEVSKKYPDKEKDIMKNAYTVDAYNSAVNDPNGEERIKKIQDNLKGLEKGELKYDHQTQTLYQPQGFFGSLVSARHELNRLSDAYDATKGMEDKGDDVGLINYLNGTLHRDPDDPIKAPSGRMGQLGEGIGGMPIKGIAAGLVASAGTAMLGNPEASPNAFHLASASMNARDMFKIGYQNALEQNYRQFKTEHPDMSDQEALKKSQDLATKQASVDAAQAFALQYVGGKVGFGAASQLKKGLTSALSEVKDELGKKSIETIGVGGIGAGGQVVKNIMAQKSGLDVKTTEGAGEAFDSGVLLTGAMTMLGLGGDLLKKATKNKLGGGLGKLPENVTDEALNRLQQTETLTPDQAKNVGDIVKEQRALEQLIPNDIPETDRLKVGAKIKERSLLKQKLENVDEAYHPEIKEDIKKLNEDIINISKGSERGDLQKLVNKEINDGNVQGAAVEYLKHAGEGELKNEVLKDIAEQAHDPNSEQQTIATFGENIVNKAKELYPNKAEPIEDGAGKVPAEQIGAVDVSEHGEDTKTQQGLENGTQPSKLSDAGIAEAKELGKHMSENGQTKIISSEVERAKETAKTAAAEAKKITGKDVPTETNPVLNTWNIGEYDGKPEGSFSEEQWIKKPNEAPKGGESFNDFTKRMEEADKYIKSLPEDTHVVTHSKVMRALYALDKTNGKWTDETTQIFLNNKELSNAKDVRGNQGFVPESGQTGEGSQVDSGGDIQQIQANAPERGEIEQQAGGGSVEEKNQAPDQKGELKVDEAYGLPFIDDPEDKQSGIKNIISRSTRFERRLPEVETSKLGTDQEVLNQGKELVESGKINPLDVVNRILENKGGMEPDEAKAMQYYMHQLAQHDTNLRERLTNATDEVEKADINGQIQQLSDEIDAATQANIISGKAWSDVGNIRQIISDTGFNASRDLATIKEAYGGKIPAEVQARLDKVIKERNEALNKLAKLQATEKTKAVEETIKKEGSKKNPKKTAEDFKKERTDIKKSISDKLKKGRTGESGLTAVPLPFAKELITITPDIFKLIKSYAEEGVQKTEEIINRLHDVLKDEIDGIQKADIVNLLAGRYKSEGETSPIAQRIRDFRTEANLWTKIADAMKMEEETPAKKQEKNKKLQDLRDRLSEIRSRNKEAVKAIKDILTPEEVKKEFTDVEKEVKRLEKQRKATETQYANKKYLQPEQKRPNIISNEIVKEKQKIVNAQYKIRVEKRKAFESQKNFYQKALMWAGRGFRLSILSGYNVLAKLGAASTIGGALKRLPEQGIGYIYGQAFRGISERAPIEGFVNAQAEAKFYKEFFNPKTFAKNALEILKTGESPLSKKFSSGQYEHIPGLYLPTDLHQIIKDPLKRGTFEASLKNAMAWAERNGLDINDDLVVQSLETAAYKRAQYEIFQESNVLSRKFNEWKSKMEQSGNWGATGKFLADFLVPVSTVPTNIARRVVTTSPLGLIRGVKDVVSAYREGIEKLTPEQADSVMKQLKQGTLGTALWLVGWYGWSSFGGLYSRFDPNKSRDMGDLKSDEMSVGGKMIPKPVQHALPLEIIQFAATARRVYDHYNEKGASDFESTEKAGLAAIGGLVEQIPILESGAHAVEATTDPYQAKKLEDDVKRRFEPQILKETGIIGKDKGGSGGGAGAGGTYKTERQHKLSKTHK